MISNEERREIAARLRELADANEGCLGMERVNRVLRDGQAILGTSGLASVADVLRRHADLIDRPTCKNADSHYDVFECSECRCKAEVISECGNEYGELFHVPYMPSYCPACGAKVEGVEE